MKKTIIKIFNKYIYLFLTIITTLIAITLFFGNILNINEIQTLPIYRGLNNEIFYFQFLKQENLNEIQNSIYFKNYYKFTLNNLSIPLFYIQKLILQVNANIQLTINIFVIIGFIISTLTSYSIFRLFNSSKIISSIFAIIFSFSYYHQYENSVINTSWYGLSLYFIYYCFILIKSDSLPKNNFYLIFYTYCFLNLFINLQYALIGWFLITSSILIIKFIQKKSTPISLLIFPYIYLLLIYLVYNLNLYYFEVNDISILKLSEIENSQFKITQLFLPNIDHHLSAFSEISNNYQYNYTFNNDNNTASIGFISLIGLIIILISAIHYSFKKELNKYPFDSTIQSGFSLILFILTLTTTGSLSAFISYQNTAFIIEWFRISLFINFINFIVLVEIINYLAQKISSKKIIYLLTFIFVFALYDQSPRHPEKEKYNIAQENIDIHNIIKDININNYKLSTPVKILVLPINNISSNNEFTRKNLFINNRLANYINNYQTIDESTLIQLSHLTFDKQIDLAKKLNFNYILINKKHFCDTKKLGVNFRNMQETDNFTLYKIEQSIIDNNEVDLNNFLSYKINNPSLTCYP